MSNSDWEKASNLAADFRGYFRRAKIDNFTQAGPKSLDDIWRSNGHFPCAGYVGVYFIFDENQKLLYIGKASASSSIGKRLSTYFKSVPNSPWQWKTADEHSWSSTPHSVAAIGVEKMDVGINGQGWLAASLEEFLISRFGDLPDNTQLKN